VQIDQGALPAVAADERVGVADGLPRGLASLGGREPQVRGGPGPQSLSVEVLADELLTVGADEVVVEEGEDARRVVVLDGQFRSAGGIEGGAGPAGADEVLRWAREDQAAAEQRTGHLDRTPQLLAGGE